MEGKTSVTLRYIPPTCGENTQESLRARSGVPAALTHSREVGTKKKK